MEKQKHGITLISLVITVVVLLILAGVAISIVVSPEGLFTKAEQAKTDMDAKVAEEQIKIDEVLSYLGIDPPVELPAGWETSKVAGVVEETSTNRKAPIPVGYTASKISTEDEISEGLVIYQTDTEVTGEPNSDAHITAMEGINQYVWIPVDDINDMIMCKHNNITQGSYEENGATVTTTTCKLEYDVTANEITCKTHGYTTSTELTDSTIDTTGLAGRSYGVDVIDLDGIYQTNMTFTEASKDAHKFVANSESSDSAYHEPDLVTDEDNSNYQLVLKEATVNALTSANAFKHQLNNKFIEMAKSVAKYGGFYISRYEPSYEDNKVISKKNKAVLTAADSASGNYLAGEKWYGLYNKTLNSVEKEESVNSHMIWGCQHDMIIKFLSENSINEPQIGHETRQANTQKLTGETTTDIMSNIYDLEGNNLEWTAQAYSTGARVYRGGYFFFADYEYFNPASYREISFPSDTYSECTSRFTLCLK